MVLEFKNPNSLMHPQPHLFSLFPRVRLRFTKVGKLETELQSVTYLKDMFVEKIGV